MPDIICKKFRPVLSDETMHLAFPFRLAITVSFLIKEPSFWFQIISIFGSSILKAASNQLEPHNIDSYLHISSAFWNLNGSISSPVTSPRPISSSRALLTEEFTFVRSGLNILDREINHFIKWNSSFFYNRRIKCDLIR